MPWACACFPHNSHVTTEHKHDDVSEWWFTIRESQKNRFPLFTFELSHLVSGEIFHLQMG